MGTTTATSASRICRLLLGAGAIGVVAIAGAPSAGADTCVGNPNANTVSDVPGVNVEFEFGLEVAFGFG